MPGTIRVILVLVTAATLSYSGLFAFRADARALMTAAPEATEPGSAPPAGQVQV